MFTVSNPTPMETIEKTIVQKTFRILGYTENVNTCDCCGRQDLKGTIAMETQDGGINYFGVVCASHMTKRTTKEITHEYKQAIKDAIENAKKEVRNSDEWRNYQKAYKSVNDEQDGLERIKTPSDIIVAKWREWDAILKPFSLLLEEKAKSILVKYHLEEKMLWKIK